MDKEAFERYKEEALSLLGRCEGRTYEFGEGALKTASTLYLCGHETVEALKALRERAEAEYDNPTQAKRFPLSKLFKLINPDMPAHHFSVNKEKRFRHIKSPRRVAEMLEREVAVWANKERKALREQLADAEPARRSERMAELEEKISEANTRVKQLIDTYVPPDSDDGEGYFKGYEVRIISKQRAKEYASLHFYLEGEKRQRHAHLSIEAPNVLYFVPHQRSDEIVERFMRDAEIAIGDIFAVKES